MLKTHPLHIIANSGGETSGLLTWLLFNSSDIDRRTISVCFQNTGEEHESCLSFLQQQEKHLQVEFTWLEYDFPDGFAETILIKAPTYENLEQYGFEGMYNLALLDRIRWQEEEVKFKAAKADIEKAGLDFQEVKEFSADYSRCLRDFYALFGAKRLNLGKQYRVVNYHTADRAGAPMLRTLLYKNAIRYVKQAPFVVPNPSQRFSTGDLKIKTCDRWIKESGIKNFKRYVGLRFDEPERYLRNLDSKGINQMPLFDLKITKQDVAEFWEAMPFRLAVHNKPYLGNCTYCYLKTDVKRIAACKESPGSFQRLAIIERAAGDYMKRGQPATKVIEAAAGIESVTDDFLASDNGEALSCFC